MGDFLQNCLCIRIRSKVFIMIVLSHRYIWSSSHKNRQQILNCLWNLPNLKCAMLNIVLLFLCALGLYVMVFVMQNFLKPFEKFVKIK